MLCRSCCWREYIGFISRRRSPSRWPGGCNNPAACQSSGAFLDEEYLEGDFQFWEMKKGMFLEVTVRWLIFHQGIARIEELSQQVDFSCSSIKIYSVVLQSETQASPDWLSWADIWQSDNLSRYLTGAGDEVDNRRTGERERFLFWKTPGYWGGDLWDIFIFHR